MIKTDKEYTKHMIWYKISSDRTPTKPFVYVWYDIVNDKHYVGSHNGTKGYSYSTGGTAISSELLERPDDFRRVYLRHTETVNEARNLESKAIKEVKANLSLAWYNRQGSSRLKFEQDEIKKKMESSILEFPQLDKNSKFDVVMLNLPTSKNRWATQFKNSEYFLLSLEYIDSIDCILLATKYITKIIDIIAKEKIILSKDSVGFFDKKITDIKPKPVRKPDGRKRNPRRKKKVTGSWLFVRG